MVRSLTCALLLSAVFPSGVLIGGEPQPEVRNSEGTNIFSAPFLWQNDFGQTVSFNRWEGRPLAVAMVYADCQMGCPTTIESLRFLERKVGNQCQFVVVTLDPESDSVESLHELRLSEQISAQISLLRGSRLATQQLASFLGIAYRREGSNLAHQSVIILVDGQGKVRARFPGARPDLDGFRRALSSCAPVTPTTSTSPRR